MPSYIKKTVVIGLGGTGRDAVLYLKKRLMNVYGEIPPAMKFLVIDTTDKESLRSEYGEIKLEAGEFIKMEVKNPHSLVKNNKEVKSWFPDNIRLFTLTSGAKQVRALGRLAAFANAPQIDRSIKNLISSIRDFRIGRINENYEIISDNIIVNVVASLAGGTGSGCFFDVSVLAREQLDATDKLIGYFLLPDVFAGKPATHNVEPNTYGAIREIDYFFNIDISAEPIKYLFGGTERTVDKHLFDFVYLINNINRSGKEFDDIQHLADLLGMGILLHSTATGKGAADIIDNIEQQLTTKKWWCKVPVYSSFGISELIYRGNELAEIMAKQVAFDIIQKTFIGTEDTDIRSEVEKFIDSCGIREDTADDVIDKILKPKSFRKITIKKNISKKDINTINSNKERHLDGEKRKIEDDAERNYNKITNDMMGSLYEYIERHLSRPKGLNYIINFLSIFEGILNEYKSMMDSERADYENKLKELSGYYEKIQEDIAKASKKLFGANKAVKEASIKLKSIVDRELEYYMEIVRRDKAFSFFAKIIEEVANRKSELADLSEHLNVLAQTFSQDIQRLRLQKKSIKPFELELKTDTILDIKKPCVNETDFLNWLRENNYSLLELPKMMFKDIENIFMRYGYEQDAIKGLKNKRIEDILKELPEAEFNSYIRTLDEMASPLWQYDTGHVSGDKKTENIYLFGVYSREDTILTQDKIRKIIQMQFDPAIVSTGDSKRIVCFKIESAVPAFVINNMRKYREKYLDPDRPFSYHIWRDWEEKLLDCFPMSEEETSRKYWSLGLATPFNFIIKNGPYYYIISEKGKRTEGNRLKLGQGRAEAMKKFLNDAELIKELQEKIEKRTQDLGNKRVIEELKAYGNKLERDAINQTEKIKRQIEKELTDIEEYINELSV